MTKLTSPSAEKRRGGSFAATFKEYLDFIVGVDPETKSVVINLDEEGNDIWELDENEVQQLIGALSARFVELMMMKKR